PRPLAAALRWQAEADPRRVHVFPLEGDGRERPITYGELRARAVAVAAGLAARPIRRGDAVGLMLRTEEDFFYAFFGTLLAGGVSVPIYRPHRGRRPGCSADGPRGRRTGSGRGDTPVEAFDRRSTSNEA